MIDMDYQGHVERGRILVSGNGGGIKSEITPSNESIDKFVRDRVLVYLSKNHDYGDSVNKSLDKYGIVAFQVRATDKINRLRILMSKDAKVEDEKVEDTVLDLFNYSAMSMAWKQGKDGEFDALKLSNIVNIIEQFAKYPNSLIDFLDVVEVIDKSGSNDIEVIKLMKKIIKDSIMEAV